MTRIKITTSMTTTIFEVQSPIDETFEIRYLDCLYCGGPFRETVFNHRQKFCRDQHRKLYFKLGIAKCETISRLPTFLVL